ncbi:MAG: hypothetical protein ACIAS6_03115 [Phycisphaerales bacterium JB060]
MSTTPPIPETIRNLRVDGYTNVYELVPDATRLFGTESLFGDWQSPVLLLAQDFANSSFIRRRIETNHHDPYSHDCMLRTNKNLYRLARDVVTDGALYGSALGPMLKDTDGMSTSLPNRKKAFQAASVILRFTIRNMPNLRTIVCMGGVACSSIQHTFFPTSSHALPFKPGQAPIPLPGSDILVFTTFHPAARVSTERAHEAWRAIARTSRAG